MKEENEDGRKQKHDLVQFNLFNSINEKNLSKYIYKLSMDTGKYSTLE